MGTRIADSQQYRHLYSTPEADGIFDERARLSQWLRILAALAVAQAELGIIPPAAADAISRHTDGAELDLPEIAAVTRSSSHSTLGLIRAVQDILPADAREYVYYGATVQDLTDTWFGIVIAQIGDIVWRDLHTIESHILTLARRYRDTPMAGRTHGQPGPPITFGFKAAGWADEIRRHIERLADGRGRWPTGQLAGAVGALAFFGDAALPLREAYCRRLGLAEPRVSWLTARDRVAEFGTLLAMVCATLARVGDEVYELSRPEIGELAEPWRPGTVSSITMPHKRNPEISEHLDTLARLSRAHAGVLLEGMVGAHERDGRSWKAEWIALPEICMMTAAALHLTKPLVEGLRVDPDAMAANLSRFGDQASSERLLAGLAAVHGKHRAQRILQEQADAGHTGDLGASIVAAGYATAEQVASWAAARATDAAGVMIDAVLDAATAARAAEPAQWR